MRFFSNNRVYQPRVGRRYFWMRHLVLPLIFALFLVFIYPRTGLDAQLMQLFYDHNALVFPLKHHAFLEKFMHQDLKYLMVMISLLTFILWLLSFKGWRLNNTKLQTYHQPFLWAFVGMVISTSAISLLKHFSNHACPWDLLAYGGTQPLISLFGRLPVGATAGHCFPGGHASGGFALMAFYFAFRDSAPKIAKAGLALGLLFGFAMGWAQMMRGAHFMSHNLWTAWIVWMLLLAQYLVWSPNPFTKKS